MEIDYLKIGKATDLEGQDRKLYRMLEIFPGLVSWTTLLGLLILSFFTPAFVAFFIIAFDIYWLLLVIYLGIHLVVAFSRMKKNLRIDWREECIKLQGEKAGLRNEIKFAWDEIVHLVILPTYTESADFIRTSFEALVNCGYPLDKMIVVLATEGREGEAAVKKAEIIEKEFGHKFYRFLVTVHPGDIVGELKGKGANQAWAAKRVREEIIDREQLDYDKILVSVFDIDTVIYPDYFYNLSYKFLTVERPYRASYQPIPVYHNNIWQAPFFARIAASSNTFWQMMQQIRQEKLATYSSHSMTWKALVDIGFWSTTMVSEDSRIFWHCYCFYRGDYRVEPMNYPVSMDVCMDESFSQTAKNLYKQQKRWGWGVENLPYLMFNVIKNWHTYPRKEMVSRIFTQLYGFHSWATNALIIAVVGWAPLILGGDKFNTSVLSVNLPIISRSLMMAAMMGLVLSAIVATLLLPPKPKNYSFFKYLVMPFQWVILPVSIVVFGAIPGLESQTLLMLGKYMGFNVTPKSR